MILTRCLGKNPSCKILEQILARSYKVLGSDSGKIWQGSSDKILEKILARSHTKFLQAILAKFGRVHLTRFLKNFFARSWLANGIATSILSMLTVGVCVCVCVWGGGGGGGVVCGEMSREYFLGSTHTLGPRVVKHW